MDGRSEAHDDATETAWRIHAALMDWTGKVDAKASFALSLESAAVTALVAFSGGFADPASGHGRMAEIGLYWCGVGFLIVAIAMAVVVVMPRLGRVRSKADWQAGFVYFGHLRHWSPCRLAEALRSKDPLPVLSRQVIVMSRISWRKHRLVQLSLAVGVLGVAMAATAWFLG
ncbi:Pycsar system effector family protein [Streptomyces noursei]|uniref:Pycsar system effector family protein n=1 Tax=Streptomyces noursei TaxID=1971 RepID=UPI0023B7B11C|nr:Pycsar system effector family protein [Streptomyces noursei]